MFLSYLGIFCCRWWWMSSTCSTLLESPDGLIFRVAAVLQLPWVDKKCSKLSEIQPNLSNLIQIMNEQNESYKVKQEIESLFQNIHESLFTSLQQWYWSCCTSLFSMNLWQIMFLFWLVLNRNIFHIVLVKCIKLWPVPASLLVSVELF